ncbi:MAG: fibronectin-binding protein EfbA [Candidatus Rifleibacteriota bacterium]
MDYLSLRKHCTELSDALKDRPLVARVFDIPGRGFCLKLKRLSGPGYFVFQLDQSCQGCWLSDEAHEVEKNSSLVRTLQRLVVNGRIFAVELCGHESKLEFDRVLRIQIAVIDNFFGGRTDFNLVCEFTGKISDIFLCDSELKIIDRISRTTNNKLGDFYSLPESDCRINPFNCSESELIEVFSLPQNECAKSLGVLSPQVRKELARRTSEKKTPEALAGEFRKLIAESFEKPGCFVVLAENRVKAICPYLPSFTEGDEVKKFATFNQALDFIDRELSGKIRFERAKKHILNNFRKMRDEKMRLIENQKKLKEQYLNSEELQKTGNLLVSNLYRIPRGAREIEVEDWETGKLVKLKLEPDKPISLQAQKFFHRYKKAQRGVKEVEKRIAELQSDIKWIDEQLWLTENAGNEADLPVKIEKPRHDGAGRGNNSKKKKNYIKPLLEMDGCRYYVGKNGRQNDIVTFQIGKKGDRWFHANDVPGAHVILKKYSGEISEADLVNGAILAAWFSFARESSKVAVDTTDVAFVRKIPGGGPGRVSYTNQKTLFVNPQMARKLLEKNDQEKYET